MLILNWPVLNSEIDGFNHIVYLSIGKVGLSLGRLRLGGKVYAQITVSAGRFAVIARRDCGIVFTSS